LFFKQLKVTEALFGTRSKRFGIILLLVHWLFNDTV